MLHSGLEDVTGYPHLCHIRIGKEADEGKRLICKPIACFNNDQYSNKRNSHETCLIIDQFSVDGHSILRISPRLVDASFKPRDFVGSSGKPTA
jgi:hypothetical protein